MNQSRGHDGPAYYKSHVSVPLIFLGFLNVAAVLINNLFLQRHIGFYEKKTILEYVLI